MAAEFLVMLYEYSPLFYIAVISLCFIITVAVVLGWFGFDVPVILRSSDETESVIPVPERKMVQVTNPFALEINCTCGSVTGFVLNIVISVQKEDKEEYFTQMPPALEVTDFGLLPRDRYPLVAVLTLAHSETRDNYNIASSVTVIHVPDDKYRLSTRILFQYLLTAHGTLYDLKPLFMSADNSNSSGTSEPYAGTQGAEPQPERAGEKGEESDSEGEWPDIQGRDCVVCQNASINRVLLPCRHACVCDGCVCRFQHCPICRAFVFESFALANRPAHDDDDDDEEDFTD
ncbi:cell growth regulator with RING finger domain protein 1 isoform X2 [Danio aesculapii]|uniref:cell growth regulator with RING finger domain protein 1 isoform X2 n=1 Tax=Danio aesculapii TaxID=1142201 RepID=UPI0024C0BA28|nr:cell growth regulator with RING finger domain protein 1 isoform X2 [Danio aesculapii]